MSIEDRLREMRVTGAMATCFGSLLLGLPFAIAWGLDEGIGNQPVPRGLRQLVVFAAALHLGSVGYRLVKAALAWEPVASIVDDLLSAYGLLAVAFAAGWAMHSYGVPGLAGLVLAAPSGWGFYLLARAMAPRRGGRVEVRAANLPTTEPRDDLPAAVEPMKKNAAPALSNYSLGAAAIGLGLACLQIDGPAYATKYRSEYPPQLFGIGLIVIGGWTVVREYRRRSREEQ